jgi:uncharacterized protein (TIGR04255 family)
VGQQAIVRHRFDDSEGWSVVVASESIWLETTAYIDIDDFVDRWSWVQDAVHSVLRLRSVTRVGLRYVNQLQLGDRPIREALSDAIDARLLAPWSILDEEDGAEVVASLQELRVTRENSGLTMRHGLVPERIYLLDFDHFREGPQGPAVVDRVVKRLREFNDAIADAFEKSVTPAQWQKFDPETSDDDVE